MRKPRPLGLLVLALSLTTACGSTVANQGQALSGSAGTGDSLSVDQGTTGDGLGVPGAIDTSDGLATGGEAGVPGSAGTPGGAAGGTSGTSGSPGGSGGSAGGSAGSSGGASGGTSGGASVTDPIKIGLFSTDFAKAAAAIGGGSANETSNTSVDNVWKRLIAQMNKNGGAGGRKMEPVSYVQDGTSNNYPADYAAACEFFARDQKVAIVLAASIPDIDFAACLLKAGIPTINVSHSGPDRARWTRVPGLILPSGVSYDAAAATLIDQMRAAGMLTTKDKVGVILSECPNVQQVYKDVVEPRLKKYGIAVEPFTANECIKGFSGVSSVGNGAQAAVLRFQRTGVTQVMPLLASLENLMTGLFAQAAENQGYRPGYILSTGARAEEIKQGGTVPDEQFKNMKGVGWIPSYDLYALGIKLSPQASACLKLANDAGMKPASPVEQAGMLFSCDVLQFLDKVLTATRGASDLQTVVGTARRFTDYVSATTLGQPGDFRDVDNMEFGSVFAADASCKCIRYKGSPVRVAP